MSIVSVIAGALVAGGAAISCLNFYLSFVRYALHFWRGRSPSEFRRKSGFPLVGSLGVVIGLAVMRLWASLPAMPLPALALGIAALDTGGVHWFIMSQGWGWFERKRRPNWPD